MILCKNIPQKNNKFNLFIFKDKTIISFRSVDSKSFTMSLVIEKLSNEIVKNVECSGTYGYVKISNGDKFCIMTEKFANNYMKKIKEMEIYEDDVWICTWMKSGTTWAQEMIWLLNNNLDYKKARDIPLIQRFAFIE